MTDAVRKLIRRTPDGAFTLDLDYFEYQTTAARSYSPRFVELFGPPRNPYEPIDLETADGQRFADCAASVQRVLEDTLVDIARALHHETGLPDLCLGGGVALNGVANARILAESGFERVFVPPAPGDAGCALGAALYADRIYFGNPDRDVPDHPFWGPAVDATELARAAREDDQLVEELDDAALIERIADELAAGRIVGWMDGASEFGPRALGHRSILAAPHCGRDARPAQSRHQVSRGVPAVRAGRRPSRRPTAISSCRRAARVWRASCRASFRCGPSGERGWRRSRTWTASARVQTLERDMAPRLHALLEAYGRRSGIPVLLNTSFNVAGEPIVNRALEGYSTFRRCGIDVLVAGPTLVTKRARLRARRRRRPSHDQETRQDAAPADRARQRRPDRSPISRAGCGAATRASAGSCRWRSFSACSAWC